MCALLWKSYPKRMMGRATAADDEVPNRPPLALGTRNLAKPVGQLVLGATLRFKLQYLYAYSFWSALPFLLVRSSILLLSLPRNLVMINVDFHTFRRRVSPQSLPAQDYALPRGPSPSRWTFRVCVNGRRRDDSADGEVVDITRGAR